MTLKKCLVKPVIVLALEERGKLVSFLNILVAIDRRTAPKVKTRTVKNAKAKRGEDKARVTASLLSLHDGYISRDFFVIVHSDKQLMFKQACCW